MFDRLEEVAIAEQNTSESFTHTVNVGGSDPTGMVVAVGVGYDWWLTDEWSWGVMGRLVYAPLDLNGTSFSTWEPAVVASLTWH